MKAIQKNCLVMAMVISSNDLHSNSSKSFIRVFDSKETHEVEAFNKMLTDPLWINASSFCNQCQILIEYMHNENVNVSFSKLGSLFGNRHCVQKRFYTITKADLIKSTGRPKLLAP